MEFGKEECASRVMELERGKMKDRGRKFAVPLKTVLNGLLPGRGLVSISMFCWWCMLTR